MKRENRILQRLCFNLFYLVVAVGLIALLGIGCGDTEDPLKTGYFYDNEVQGMGYFCDDRYGVTGEWGAFEYREGATITFVIGNIELGTAMAKAIMTPVDLVPGAVDETDIRVTNMARLLQSLDVDGYLINGIYISEDIRNEALWRSLDFSLSTQDFGDNADVRAFFNTLNALGLLDYKDEDEDGEISISEMKDRELLSAEEAQEHLRDTIAVNAFIITPVENEVLLVGGSIDFWGTGSVLEGSIVSYEWDFGDGEISKEQNPSHTYSSEGTYTVTLTLTSDNGREGETSVNIHLRISEPAS
jgi:hypothetical protein